jgi:acyl carrier protein
MDETEIIKKLTDVFRDNLDLDDLSLTLETSAADVDGWDSLAHVRLMIATERAFGCRFETAEISGLKNVGALVELLQQKSA